MRVSDRFDLTGRTAVVTAGTGGFGGHCAHALGRAGATVVLVASDADEGRHLVEGMRADDVDAHFLRADVRNPEHVEQTVTTVLERHGRVDVLVNAVDARSPCSSTTLPFADWREVMDVNLDTVWLWSQSFGRVFVEQRRGVIVTVSSVAGSIAGRPHWDVARGVSKAAVNHLTRVLAGEWAAYGVRVNAVAPGFTGTDGDATEDPRTRRHVLEDTPMERLGTVEEITPAVVFLASDASSFITGTVLTADGGYSTC